MAWVNGKWLESKERGHLINEKAAIIEMLDSEFPDIKDMPSEIATDYIDTMSELERLERINDCEKNLLEFAYEYFGEEANKGNDGNWIPEGATLETAPSFHNEICEIMDEVSHKRRNDKVGVAAPRSHAKSSFLSKAYAIREVVYRLRRYVIIISETPSVSKANMEWISEQLKNNEKLRQDFGPLLSPKSQGNDRDNSEEFIAWHYVDEKQERKKQLALVQAASTGQALRGRNWNGNRPDLIICDDLEDAKTNAATPELRKKLRDWFSQVVIPLGDPKGEKTAIVYMGTTVHFDALLMHILYKRSDFRTKIYRAIIDLPERQDLWEECRKIYIDRENPNRADDARSFYEENREEMDKGVNVLWQDVQPIYKLMTWKWDNGSKAFNTEYMNNPVDEESMIFNPNNFTYWTDSESLIPYDNGKFTVTMGVDFAMGKQRGDYSAITAVARHNDTGIYFVLDSYGERIKPDAFMDVIVSKVLKYQPDAIAAEAQAAQEFFVDHLKEALRANGYPASTRVKKIYQRTRKELRIEAMLPDIENNTIQFSRNHGLLLEQFERYGTGDHDDLIDATEQAISIAKKAKVRIMSKPSWL